MRVLPDAAEAAARDLDAFFGSDLPAHQSGTPEPGVAAAVDGRILYVGGSASGWLFDEVRYVVADRLPGTTFMLLDDADHLFAITRAPEVASELGPFLNTVSPLPDRMRH